MSSKVKEYLEQIKNRRERKGERKPKEENILKRFNWNDKRGWEVLMTKEIKKIILEKINL